MIHSINRYWHEKKTEMDAYFYGQKDDILTLNLKVFRNLSIISVVALVILFLLWQTRKPDRSIVLMQLLFFSVIFIHMLVALYINKHRLSNHFLERLFCVTFSLCIFIMLIYFDTVCTPNAGQVFSSAFLVVAPVIFIMSAVRMFIDQVFFVIIYAVFAIQYKDSVYATEDFYALGVAFIFSIILYVVIIKLRLEVNSEVVKFRSFSETDELTGLRNRRAANVQISYMLGLPRGVNSCALMMVDVDNFKTINDTLGHKTGDKVLQDVAKVLASEFRKSDVVSRFGGDEFMIFISGFTDEQLVERKCKAIGEKLKEVLKGTYSVTCSIGVSVLSEKTASMADMVQSADKALYKTKNTKKGTYTITRY